MFFITADESEIFYEISYSNDNALLLFDGTDNYLFTDGRYFEEAKAAAKNCDVFLTNNLYKSAAQIIRKNKIHTVHVDDTKLSFAHHKTLTLLSGASLRQTDGFLVKKRMIKSADELHKIATAARIGKEGFKTFAKQIAKEKKWDEYTLHYRAQESLGQSGRYTMSFDPIVAIGENGANAHAKPTEKKLSKNTSILFDGGVKYERYCSDRTRTAFYNGDITFSRKQRFKEQKMQTIYDIVLKAHDMAIEHAKIGMKTGELDNIARDIIERAGYGEYFIHSLGHGVGLDIHEYPFIRRGGTDILEENMVFTIEPGIYIPGYMGVRIEDMVVLRTSGAEVF